MRASESKRLELIKKCKDLIRYEKRKCKRYESQMLNISLIDNSDKPDIIEMFYLQPTIMKIQYYQSILKYLENIKPYE